MHNEVKKIIYEVHRMERVMYHDIKARDEAFCAAVQQLVDAARLPPWRRIICYPFIKFDREWIIEAAQIGYLEMVLECCWTLGVNKDQVRAIHALIYDK